jgi:hypothetical protein
VSGLVRNVLFLKASEKGAEALVDSFCTVAAVLVKLSTRDECFKKA